MKVLALVAVLLCYGIEVTTTVSTVQYKTERQTIRPLIKSQGQGGPDGRHFDDLKSRIGRKASVVSVHSIKMTIDYRQGVQAIQATYLLSNGRFHTAPRHGKNSSTTYTVTVTLGADEYIEKVEGYTNGAFILQLMITTMRAENGTRQMYGPYGQPAIPNFTFEGYIVGFHGRSDTALNNIGVYTLTPLKKRIVYAGPLPDGGRLDEDPDLFFPPAVKMSKLYINHGITLNSLQVEYQLLDGSRLLGKKYSGALDSYGNLTIIDIGDREQIIGVECKMETYYNYIDQITFISRKGNGHVVIYGPFGRLGKKSFSVHGSIVGFFGEASNIINGIGVYYY